MNAHWYLLVFMHVASHFNGPFVSLEECVRAAHERAGYAQWICVQGISTTEER